MYATPSSPLRAPTAAATTTAGQAPDHPHRLERRRHYSYQQDGSHQQAPSTSSTTTNDNNTSISTTEMTSVSVSTSTAGAQSVVAGVVAGCVTRSCTSPLDVLKIIIQVNGPMASSSSSPSAAAATTTTRAATASTATTAAAMMRNSTKSAVFRASAATARASTATARSPVATTAVASSALLRTVRELYSMEGLRAFWRGNVAGCCRLGPYAGAKFFLFDSLQTHCLDEHPSNVQRAMCGSVAGLVATMGTYPLEIVRTRMITQTTVNTLPHLHIRGVLHGMRLITRLEGVHGLYRGGWSAVAGAIPFEGVQFGCYEYLKSTAQQQQWPAWRWPEAKRELDAVDFFVCGSVAGAVAQTVAYPFDTVKKRLQTQRVLAGGSVHEPQQMRAYYRGMCDCFKTVVREEGVLALYRGTVPNLARIVPYAAVMFSTYEMTKKGLRLLCDSSELS